MTKKIFVVGYDGQVGRELVKLGAEPYNEQRLMGWLPTSELVVINAAAITDDSKCKTEPYLAWQSNANLVAQLSQHMKVCHGRLIHISTDYVFDGQRGAYDEHDQINPDPNNTYALSKAAGELAFQSLAPQGSTLLRTQWVFGLKRKSWFNSETIWDQKGGLTYAPDLAKFLFAVAERTSVPRILHYVTKPYVTRAGAAALYGNLNPKIVPVPIGKPKDTSLRVSDYCNDIHKPMNIQEAIDEYKRTNPFENPSIL